MDGWLLFLIGLCKFFIIHLASLPLPDQAIPSLYLPDSGLSRAGRPLRRTRAAFLRPFLAHLAHHAPHRLGVIFQSGQGRRIGKIAGKVFHAAVFRFCHAHVRNSPAYVLAFTMRASHAATAVFRERHEYIEALVQSRQV